MDNELLLADRLGVIRDLITKHGEDKFYISFSGGKDSTIVSALVDLAIPGNRIPRVFFDTGIEYQEIRKFVMSLAEKDDRFVIRKPSKPIKKVLETYGYPFKSKEHSTKLNEWQRGNRETKSLRKYLSDADFSCPRMLRYQFTDAFQIKVSPYCCHQLKKYPSKRYEHESKRPVAITGMRREEGGQRDTLSCILTDKDGNLKRFHPLAVVTDEWEDWFAQRESVELCRLYYPPYNFKRTGCKGCPFNLELQKSLDVMAALLPNEKAQCEIIWKPVYEEYRRLGFRLRKGNDDGMVGLLDD